MIWSTPSPIFNALNREFDFVVDLCADADNAKCPIWLPRDLAQDWRGEGVAWLNPPYGREISDWIKKAVETPRIIVAFLPGRTNAPWWHDYVMTAKEIRFVRRKVSFTNHEGCKGVPPWGAVVVMFYPFGSPGFFQRQQKWPNCTSWDWKAA